MWARIAGLPLTLPLKARTLPAEGNGDCCGQLDVGREATFADQGAAAGGKGAFGGRGLDLVDAAGRQALRAEAPVAIDRDRDPPQLRRVLSCRGADPGVDDDPHRRRAVAGQNVRGELAVEADPHATPLFDHGGGGAAGRPDAGLRRSIARRSSRARAPDSPSPPLASQRRGFFLEGPVLDDVGVLAVAGRDVEVAGFLD